LAGSDEKPTKKTLQKVGYKSPPAHSRFKPGQSGNPSGRAKGSQNLKTLFQKILKEEVSLREGSEVRKVSKAEALMRGLVVGALKGDTRSIGTLFRLAEQTGQFDDPSNPVTGITRVIVGWKDTQNGGAAFVDTRLTRTDDIPGNRELNKEDDD
jgi:hypothetical protein